MPRTHNNCQLISRDRPLHGLRACAVTVVHRADDVRILYREARALAAAGCEMWIVGPWRQPEGMIEGVRILGLPAKRKRW